MDPQSGSVALIFFIYFLSCHICFLILNFFFRIFHLLFFYFAPFIFSVFTYLLIFLSFLSVLPYLFSDSLLSLHFPSLLFLFTLFFLIIYLYLYFHYFSIFYPIHFLILYLSIFSWSFFYLFCLLLLFSIFILFLFMCFASLAPAPLYRPFPFVRLVLRFCFPHLALFSPPRPRTRHISIHFWPRRAEKQNYNSSPRFSASSFFATRRNKEGPSANKFLRRL